MVAGRIGGIEDGQRPGLKCARLCDSVVGVGHPRGIARPAICAGGGRLDAATTKSEARSVNGRPNWRSVPGSSELEPTRRLAARG